MQSNFEPFQQTSSSFNKYDNRHVRLFGVSARAPCIPKNHNCQQEMFKAEVDRLREESSSAAKRKQEEEEMEEREAKRKKKESRLKLMAKCNEELKCSICDELFITVSLLWL